MWASWFIFKEATVGRRLKLIRKFRGYSQKEFGVALGFPEKSADVRVAQYENKARTPKKELQIKMTEILKVSPEVLSSAVSTTREELMQSLFWLEYTKGSDEIYDCLKEWKSMKDKLNTGEISPEDYLDWIFTYQSPPSGSPE